MRPEVFAFGARRSAQQRREGLGDDELAGEVDLELGAELADIDMEQGAGNGDAGIVDQAGERLPVEGRGDGCRAHRHGGGVGNVEQDRREAGAEFLFQPVGVGLFPDAAEDVEAAAGENLHAAPADACRGARDHHTLHAQLRWFPGTIRRYLPDRPGLPRNLTFRAGPPIKPAVCGQPCRCMRALQRPGPTAWGLQRLGPVRGQPERTRRIVRPVRRMSRLARND